MNYKRFHNSDSIIYTYNEVEYPYQDTKNPTFKRTCVRVHAAKNVTWQQIAEEIHSLRKDSFTSPYSVLTTCTVDYPDFVVALTLKGCLKIINSCLEAAIDVKPREYGYFDQVDCFAKEMITIRDECQMATS